MNLLAPALAIIFGLVGLVWGADRFVTGSAALARNFGLSPLVIGLTIVSIGTSAPEIIVSINAALKDAGAIAVGNALGSNLANIGLVLGLTTLVAPLPIQKHLMTQEGPVLLLVTACAGYLLWDGELLRIESLSLFLVMFPLLALTVIYKKRHPSGEETEQTEEIPELSTPTALLWLAIGLAALLTSAEILVWGAKNVALSLGVSQLIIGLTVVAVGTSLPELAASIISARRGHADIAIGNIFGSNLFNLMAVMSVSGIIAPLSLGPEVFMRDYLYMTLLSVLLVAAIFLSHRQNLKTGNPARLSARFGLILLSLYGLYYVLLATPPMG